ncbi:MAG: toll/interleukin-1 receptor domain-containing protein [Candidatus Promineifilaceae bacterium]
MADVFISYASEDREMAQKLAHAIGATGRSVWWDRKIIAGQTFDQVIENELDTARSVVVLWSKHSIASEWVKNEAAVASERSVLVPALIESVKLPLEFRRKQTADLIGWDGDSTHSGFTALCDGISAAIGSAPQPEQIMHQKQKLPWNRRVAFIAVAAIIVVLGIVTYSIVLWQTSTPTSATQEPGAIANAPPESKNLPNTITDPADLVVGTYYGNVISDSKGSSLSDVTLTVTKLDKRTVRITSDYPRMGTVDVPLTRIGNKIFNGSGNTVLILDLSQHPPRLDYNPYGEVAYAGSKQ